MLAGSKQCVVKPALSFKIICNPVCKADDDTWMLEDFTTSAFMITDPLCANINVFDPNSFFQVNSIYHYLFLFAKILDVCMIIVLKCLFRRTLFMPNFPDQTSVHRFNNQLQEAV